MKIRTLPAKSGFEWLKKSIRLIKKHPLPFASISLVFTFLQVLPGLIPMIGPFLFFVAAPLLGFCFLHVFREADKGVRPTLKQFFSLFSQEHLIIKRLLIVGLINSVAMLLVLSISALFDDGLLMKILTGDKRLKPADLKSPALNNSLPIFAALFALVQAALWYVPQFIGWHKLGVSQSMFYSSVAVWRNKSAFFVYGLSWLVIAWTSVTILVLLASAFAALFGAANTQIFGALQVPFSLLMMALAYASFFFSYKDILVEIQPEESA